MDHPPSGRYVECRTSEPGLGFYTSFFLNAAKGKGGYPYKAYSAFCLEAQHYPNSPNVVSNSVSVLFSKFLHPTF
jgi:aldose 1-epimerase